jgi:hypothetical protein
MELNERLVGKMVQRGAVLLAAFEKIDHKKFFVVVGDDGKDVVGFFFINSKVAAFINSKQSFMDMQMHIKRSCYKDFLTHDSFIDCHKISKISKQKLVRQIKSGEAQYCGELTPDDVELMLENLRRSTIFSDGEKNVFFKP